MQDILPVITLFIGFLTSSLLEFWRDKRAVSREKEARAENFKIEVHLRRIEFQRKNLLELQDSLADLARMITRCKLHYDLNDSSDKEYGGVDLPDDINIGLFEAQRETAKLIVRIHDSKITNLVDEIKDKCASVGLADSRLEASLTIVKLYDLYDGVSKRIGQVYKQLDNVENDLVESNPYSGTP
jgi:hypothetical protein